VRKDSVYKTLNCDAWDEERDARNWKGATPVIAHPPCRAWGGMSHMAKPKPGEKALAILAVEKIRAYGGVLEHPRRSKLWRVCGLPQPGEKKDAYGGWTLALDQYWFGHRAKKATFLYIVGCEPKNIPPLPLKLGNPECILGTPGRRKDGTRRLKYTEISKAEREQTPPEFAKWLIQLVGKIEHRHSTA